jgi:hypothetical protein
VHHTDAEREFAHDRQSGVGRLDKALEAATLDRWTIVDMKCDWKIAFPFKKQGSLPPYHATPPEQAHPSRRALQRPGVSLIASRATRSTASRE